MRPILLIISALILFANITIGQTKIHPKYYAVYFKDKNGTEFTTDKPEEFLSPKAIERRKKYNIPITEQDLPISKTYVQKLQELGFIVKETSKWLNCAIIYVEDTSKLQEITKLDFVIAKPNPIEKNYKQKKLKQAKINIDQSSIPADKYKYGYADKQVKMLNVNKLHSLGYTGEGITIAILDAGFFQVNSLTIFDSLWANKQILDYYNFVDNNTDVFNNARHGMMVLSTIAGNLPNYLGTAPKAKFYLFVTEDENSEYPIEEYNYVCACEKADSLGVDLIHSSLGYANFDDKALSYKYKEMNGNTAISTIGADIAASKGIMVTTSAGNEGDTHWRHITAPADADSVLSVGAVTYNGKYAYFSSQGPTFDKRVKPDVMAMGYGVFVSGTKDMSIVSSSGTSFSGPIMAGAVACLMQAFPEKTNIEIMNAIRRCSSNVKHPNEKLGYGIPDFYKAYIFLKNQK